MKTTVDSSIIDNSLTQFWIIPVMIISDDTFDSMGRYFKIADIQWWICFAVPSEFYSFVFNIIIYVNIVKMGVIFWFGLTVLIVSFKSTHSILMRENM